MTRQRRRCPTRIQSAPSLPTDMLQNSSLWNSFQTHTWSLHPPLDSDINLAHKKTKRYCMNVSFILQAKVSTSPFKLHHACMQFVVHRLPIPERISREGLHCTSNIPWITLTHIWILHHLLLPDGCILSLRVELQQ